MNQYSTLTLILGAVALILLVVALAADVPVALYIGFVAALGAVIVAFRDRKA